jgi:hypothetical protein
MMRLARRSSVRLLSQAAARHDPHLLEGDDGGGGLEVGVVVDPAGNMTLPCPVVILPTEDAPYANVSKGSAYRIAPVVVRICL